MRYLMLVHVDPTAEPGPDVDTDPTAWVEDLTSRGMRITGDRLRPDEETTTVRVRDGGTLLTDGPFAEVREVVAGFDLLEAADLDEALAAAAAHPMARVGAIEVRAVWPFDA